MEQYNFLLLVVLTFLCVRSAHSCSCLISHPQTDFCSVAVVIKGTIVKEELKSEDESMGIPFPLRKNYTVQFRKRDIFKGSSLLGSSDTLVIQTFGTDCDETFTLNKEYVISGYVRDGEFSTDSCMWNREYLTLEPHQRRGIRYMYEQGCNCAIHHCHGETCDVPQSLNPDQTCIWPGFYNNNDCYAKYGFCLPDIFGVCYWKQNRMLRGCLQREGGVQP